MTTTKPSNEHELLVGGIVRAALELAILRGDLRMDNGDSFEEMSESEREDVITDTWNAMNSEGTCEDGPIKELTAMYAALAAAPPPAKCVICGGEFAKCEAAGRWVGPAVAPATLQQPVDILAELDHEKYVGQAGKPLQLNPAPPGESFQQRVRRWTLACFGQEISDDKMERNHRFLEESLELVQALGCTESEAQQLVEYVYSRPQGDARQECGGVRVTLAALCNANQLDARLLGEAELDRVWAKIEKIRAKQAAKPKHSPLSSAIAQREALPVDLRGLSEKATAGPHEHVTGKYNCLVCFNAQQAKKDFELACVNYVRAALSRAGKGA